MAGETKVSDLIKDIRQGGLILPEFQRGYVWKSNQVRSYLNSLYRGYPTGSFLIWKTPTPPKVRGDLPSDETKSYRLILDGQQRLTSVYVLMEGEAPPFYEGEKLFFNLHFNVLKEEFAFYKKSEMHGNPQWVPVTGFFKQGLAPFIQSRSPEIRDFYLDNFDKLGRLDQIKNYLYYQKELTELEMDRVVEVFNLVNSSGTPLSKSDLALAHICSLWPEARDEFRSAQAVHRKDNFDFDLSFYTRCTSIVATGSALYEPLYKTPIDDVKAAWPKVTAALDYVLNVLRGDGYIDAAWTFPSTTVVVPLVAYLARTGRAHFDSDAEKRSFLHWMYAAMMWGRYSGSSETKLQEDIEGLKADDPPAQLRENLIRDRGRIKVEAKDLDGAGVRSPFFPMTYVVARSRGAVDWFNGVALYQKAIGKSFGLEIHHVFPQAVLYKSGFDTADAAHKRLVNEIANLAYLTKQANLGIAAKRPENYLPKVLAKYPEALKQQAVPQNHAMWDVKEFEVFLAARRQLLADAINTYMDSLLAKKDQKGLTIHDFISRGEGPTLEFKSSVRWDIREGAVNKELERVVSKTLAGFMNKDGGTLVVGVTDDGAIVGLGADMKTLKKPTEDGLSLHLTEIFNKYLGEVAAADARISFAHVDGHAIAVISADAATKAVFLDGTSGPEFYVRSNSSTRLLDVKEATQYIAQRWPGLA
jgi:Uncharacterized conserved protein